MTKRASLTTSAAPSRRLPARVPWWRRFFAPRRLERVEIIGESAAVSDVVWDDAARAALAGAFADARAEGRASCTGVDVVGAMLRLGQLTALERALGVEIAMEAISAEAFTGDMVASPSLSLAILVSRARALGSTRETLAPLDLLIACVQADPPVQLGLRDAGVDFASLVRFACHGVAVHARYRDVTAPAGDPLAIVLHNDDYTAQDLVVALLRRAGLDPLEAQSKMLDVHLEGESEVALLPRVDAIAVANAMLDAAAKAQAPLKVSLRAPSSSP
ncbi:MAG TPA: ATP-dependent Clp protease adaptor ClpS [Myxococcota bacterium]